MKRTLLAALAAVILLSSRSAGQSQNNLQELLKKFFYAEALPLWEYTATRRMTGSGMTRNARMDVRVTLSEGNIFTYDITGEEGDNFVINKLTEYLDGEKAALSKEGDASFNERNYRFQSSPSASGEIQKVAVKPHKDKDYLIEGDIYLGPEGQLVRTDGKLVKNPTSTLRNVKIKKEYATIAGVQMPVKVEYIGKLVPSDALLVFYWLLPHGTMTIESKYHSVNYVKVGAPP